MRKSLLLVALAVAPRAVVAGVRLRHQAQGRLADLCPDEVHGEGRPGDHHARERHRHGDQARPDRRRGLREVQQGELRQRRRDRHARQPQADAASRRAAAGRASRTTSATRSRAWSCPRRARRSRRADGTGPSFGTVDPTLQSAFTKVFDGAGITQYKLTNFRGQDRPARHGEYRGEPSSTPSTPRRARCRIPPAAACRSRSTSS